MLARGNILRLFLTRNKKQEDNEKGTINIWVNTCN